MVSASRHFISAVGLAAPPILPPLFIFARVVFPLPLALEHVPPACFLPADLPLAPSRFHWCVRLTVLVRGSRCHRFAAAGDDGDIVEPPPKPKDDVARSAVFYDRDFFIFLLLVVGTYACGSKRDSKRPGMLSREQTEEWKGWMQIVFLLHVDCQLIFLHFHNSFLRSFCLSKLTS
jgi:hypothetical protein